jgi:L-asparaginase II
MLATCVVNGWSIADYLDEGHPLQSAITAALPVLIGEPVAHVGVDGCGAPAHALSLLGLARAFRSIATADPQSSSGRVYSAMTDHPVTVGGPHRDVTAFMQLIPGLIAKDGAEGVFAAALPDGRAVALKVADGSNRARPPAMMQALRTLGVDVSGVGDAVAQQILGHGRPVGTVDPIAEYVAGGN